MDLREQDDQNEGRREGEQSANDNPGIDFSMAEPVDQVDEAQQNGKMAGFLQHSASTATDSCNGAAIGNKKAIQVIHHPDSLMQGLTRRQNQMR